MRFDSYISRTLWEPNGGYKTFSTVWTQDNTFALLKKREFTDQLFLRFGSEVFPVELRGHWTPHLQHTTTPHHDCKSQTLFSILCIQGNTTHARTHHAMTTKHTHFHTLSSPFKAVIHFQSQSYNYMKHHQLLWETTYWDVTITLWALRQKNESCNITIHKQSKSETYITQSVAQRSHHGLGFPTATDHTPCSHMTVTETGSYRLQSDCPDFLKLMAESMPPDAETVVKSEHDQSHTDMHISWGSLHLMVRNDTTVPKILMGSVQSLTSCLPSRHQPDTGLLS